jgi:bacillithiol system protein YtxJ
MQNISTTNELDTALHAPAAVLLKYSTTCPISANARREMTALEARHPDVTVYGVDVHRAADVSVAVAKQLGVEHESPQLFILRDGEPVYTVTHWDISAVDLEKHLVD